MDIPISARIVMLVDTYDALRSDRPYRNGCSHEMTIELMTKGDGRVMPGHFDPDLLRVFLGLQDEFDRTFTGIASS
jgi:putative two-component system response regulator